jgi:autoinducer 2-degrading protein
MPAPRRTLIAPAVAKERPMYAVTVTLRIKSGRMAELRALMEENARLSLQDPGCERFDLCTDPERPDDLFLYELYADRAAFDAHTASEHFKRLSPQIGPMVEDRKLVLWPDARP